MAKRKTNFTEGKQNIIAGLLEEYDIQTAEDKQFRIYSLIINILPYF